MTTNDAPTVREILNIERFFKAIAYKREGYQIKTFSYIAIKYGRDFFLLQGRVILNIGTPRVPLTSSQRIYALAATLFRN